MTLHYAPDSVGDWRIVPDCPPFSPIRMFRRFASVARAAGHDGLAAELEFAAVGEGWAKLDPFPGYTGRPRLASARAGGAFASAIVDLYEHHVGPALDGGPPPEPIMGWVAPLTLWGRVPRR